MENRDLPGLVVPHWPAWKVFLVSSSSQQILRKDIYLNTLCHIIDIHGTNITQVTGYFPGDDGLVSSLITKQQIKTLTVL